MIYIDERKARLAGQIAAADAIAEEADRLDARQTARLFHRVERCQPRKRTGKPARIAADLRASLITAAIAGDATAKRALGWR